MESIQVKLENVGTWLSDIFFSFQFTFLQGVQRSNLTVQRAVNSREGNGLGKQYGKGMKGAWGDSQISRRLLFADTIEGTSSKRCVDACHLLPSFPLLDWTSTAETAAHHDKVKAWWEECPGALSPLRQLHYSLSWNWVMFPPVMLLPDPGSFGSWKLISFSVSFTHGLQHLKPELLN